MPEFPSYRTWRINFHSGEEAARAAYEDLTSAEEVIKVLQAERGEGAIVVTCNDTGACVAVTRQSSDGRILAVIWERPTPTVAFSPERVERSGSHSLRINLHSTEEIRALQYVAEMADRRLCSSYGARFMDELARALKEYVS